MNTDTFKGRWRQLEGKVKETFGKLTDDDLLAAEVNADQLIGAIQERYGYTTEQAAAAWDEFLQRVGFAVDAAGHRIEDGRTPDDVTPPIAPAEPPLVIDKVVGQAEVDARIARKEF